MNGLTQSERVRKLGNAIRAFRGGFYSAPQPSARGRVLRWLGICREHQDISAVTALQIKARLAMVSKIRVSLGLIGAS